MPRRRSASPKPTCMAILESGELKGKKIGALVADPPRGASTSTSRSSARRRDFRAWPRSRRSTSTRAPPAARRRSGTRPSRSSSARSAAPSRRTSSIATTGKAVENDLVKALRELPEERRGWKTSGAASSARAARPSWSSTRRASARTASSAARRRSSPTTRSRRRSGRRACCRSRSRQIACATTCAAGCAATGSRRTGSRAPSLVDTRPQPLHSLLDVRRAGASAVGGRRRATTTTSTCRPRQPGPHRSRGRNGASLGAGLGRRSTTSSTTSRCRDAWHRRSTCCGRSSRFRRRNSCPYDTAFLSGHVVEHYQVVLIEAAAPRRQQMNAELEQLCAGAGAGRHATATCGIHPTFSDQTFKHVLVPVWLLAYDFGARRSFRSSPMATPARSPGVPVQRVEDLLPRRVDRRRALRSDVCGGLIPAPDRCSFCYLRLDPVRSFFNPSSRMRPILSAPRGPLLARQPLMRQNGQSASPAVKAAGELSYGVYNYCDRWCERCRFELAVPAGNWDMRRMERVTEGRLDVVDAQALHSDEELELEETSPVSARERAEFLADLSNANTEPSSPGKLARITGGDPLPPPRTGRSSVVPPVHGVRRNQPAPHRRARSDASSRW